MCPNFKEKKDQFNTSLESLYLENVRKPSYLKRGTCSSPTGRTQATFPKPQKFSDSDSCSSRKSPELGVNDPPEYNNAKRTVCAPRLPPRPARQGATPQLFALGSTENRILTHGVEEPKGTSRLCATLQWFTHHSSRGLLATLKNNLCPQSGFLEDKFWTTLTASQALGVCF